MGIFHCNSTKSNILHGCFSRFLNCTNGTKSRKASYIYIKNKPGREIPLQSENKDTRRIFMDVTIFLPQSLNRCVVFRRPCDHILASFFQHLRDVCHIRAGSRKFWHSTSYSVFLWVECSSIIIWEDNFCYRH